MDIGSNSIRLVVFDGLSRAPQPILNEKVLCGLGRGLERTGRLHEDGVRLALDNLARFAALARALGVADLNVLATAAVRDAANGPEFVREVERRAGLAPQILSGAEEARISALGVVAGMPDADGAMGDLGGGSLEVVALRKGRIGRHATLPFGPLRLRELPERRPGRLRDLLDERFAELDWLAAVKGRAFYAVGGAWRAIARLHMAQTNYPLRVIHHYSIARDDAVDFLDLVAGLGRESLERIARVPRKRLETLPLAALVLGRLLRRAKPKRLVFSALGLREGSVFARLSDAERAEDPLIAACARAGAASGRFQADGAALAAWTATLFDRADRSGSRLRLAACHLADIAWAEHPDYRAEIAFLRALRMPLTGIDHPGRAYLALTLFTRYDGTPEGGLTDPAWKLLDEERYAGAVRLGLALRLAFTLSAGTQDVLRRASISRGGRALTLRVPAARRHLVGEAVERRLEALARACDLDARIRFE